MLDKILLDQCGLDPARPVLAGVSGGPDSLCLLGILQEAGLPGRRGALQPPAAPRSRPGSGCRFRTGAPVSACLSRPPVRMCAPMPEAQALSIEEAARLLRYRFLFEAARQHGAQAVAVGHTADDQVETVLMHFVPRGRAGGL